MSGRVWLYRNLAEGKIYRVKDGKLIELTEAQARLLDLKGRDSREQMP